MPMLRHLATRCTAKRQQFATLSARGNSFLATAENVVPVRPTWSVEKLLSTYPAPSLSFDTLAHLHRLSALKSPVHGSPESESFRLQLQELLRLVEAVKLVDTSTLGGSEQTHIPDSRIWPEGKGIGVDMPKPRHLDEPHGKALLKHASKHISGQYIVETALRTRGAKHTREE